MVYSSRKSYKAGPKKYSYKHVNYAREEAGAPLWQYYVDDGVDGKSVGWCKFPISLFVRLLTVTQKEAALGR